MELSPQIQIYLSENKLVIKTSFLGGLVVLGTFSVLQSLEKI